MRISGQDCVNALQCIAMQACPEGAIERTERGQDTILCAICPVGCQIVPGKSGECRMYPMRMAR